MDPLANLNDIAEPSAVSIWPLALGWWLAIALCILIFVLVWLALAKRAKQNAARNLAIKELSFQYQSNQLTLASANELMKRACLSYCDRDSIASLYGQAWVAVLHAALKPSSPSSPSSKTEELKAQLVTFEQSLYQKESTVDPLTLFNVTQSWLQNADFERLKQLTKEANYV